MLDNVEGLFFPEKALFHFLVSNHYFKNLHKHLSKTYWARRNSVVNYLDANINI